MWAIVCITVGRFSWWCSWSITSAIKAHSLQRADNISALNKSGKHFCHPRLEPVIFDVELTCSNHWAMYVGLNHWLCCHVITYKQLSLTVHISQLLNQTPNLALGHFTEWAVASFVAKKKCYLSLFQGISGHKLAKNGLI